MTKLNASTGAVIGTYSLGATPYGICFDGANIWTANNGANTVTKVNASTGAVIGTYNVRHHSYTIYLTGEYLDGKCRRQHCDEAQRERRGRPRHLQRRHHSLRHLL